MTSMIKRVAESQAKFDGRTLVGMSRTDRERYMERARLAIETMREPTEAMIDAMEKDGGHSCYRRDAAIDEALKS